MDFKISFVNVGGRCGIGSFLKDKDKLLSYLIMFIEYLFWAGRGLGFGFIVMNKMRWFFVEFEIL